MKSSRYGTSWLSNHNTSLACWVHWLRSSIQYVLRSSLKIFVITKKMTKSALNTGCLLSGSHPRSLHVLAWVLISSHELTYEIF